MRGSRSPSRGPRRRASSVGACWGVATRRPLLSSGFSCFSVFLGRLLLMTVLLSCWLAAAGGPRGQERPLRSLPPSVAGEDGTLERDSAARGGDDTRRGRPVALSCLLSSRPQTVGRRARPGLAGYLGSLPSIHWPLLEDSRTCGGRGPVRPRPWPELRSPPCAVSVSRLLRRVFSASSPSSPFPCGHPSRNPQRSWET